MITGMWCSNKQQVDFLPGGEVDISTHHERLSYGGASNTALIVSHHDGESFRHDTGSFYQRYHTDADGPMLSRRSTRSKMLESTGLSVQLRNKD